MKTYRVTMHSRPGMTYYDGHVDVKAHTDEDAIDRALDTLRRTSFPDRSRGSWRVTSVVRLGIAQ